MRRWIQGGGHRRARRAADVTRGAGKKEPEAMPPQAAKWAETLSSTLTDLALPCRDDGPVAPRNCPLGGRDHVARGCQNVQQGSEELDAVHQSARRRRAACGKEPHQPERKRWGKSWTRRQELHDPGFYAAFPWGGYAQSKGGAPSTARPPITLPGGCLRPSWK